MPRCRTKVPQDRLIILWEKCEASQFVHRPGTDMRGSDVAHVVHIEAQQRTHLGFLEQLFDAFQSLITQSLVVYAFFPIYTHQSLCFNSHSSTPSGSLQGRGKPYLSPRHFFLEPGRCPLSVLFDSPPTAATKEKGVFGDTPNPGKGLRPLHSQKVSGRELPSSDYGLLGWPFSTAQACWKISMGYYAAYPSDHNGSQA